MKPPHWWESFFSYFVRNYDFQRGDKIYYHTHAWYLMDPWARRRLIDAYETGGPLVAEEVAHLRIESGDMGLADLKQESTPDGSYEDDPEPA